jgi:hypothetical protein
VEVVAQLLTSGSTALDVGLTVTAAAALRSAGLRLSSDRRGLPLGPAGLAP